jgi:ureidoacrylate peracid hydrolase
MARRAHFRVPSGGVAVIEAKPEPISIDLSKTVVIVVDMQNDFASKGGMFDLAGIDISMVPGAVRSTKKVLAAARDGGIKIIYLKMGYRPDLSDAGPPDSPNRLKHIPLRIGKAVRTADSTESRILVRDTWNTDIISDLAPHPDDITIYKTRFSGFYQTDLDGILKRLGAKYLIVTGLSTCVCVESTIRDAMFRDYSCVLLADCTGEPIGHDLPTSNHEASLLVIQTLFGWVSGADAFLRTLEARTGAAAKGQH